MPKKKDLSYTPLQRQTTCIKALEVYSTFTRSIPENIKKKDITLQDFQKRLDSQIWESYFVRWSTRTEQDRNITEARSNSIY